MAPKLVPIDKAVTILAFLYWLSFEHIAFFTPEDYGGSLLVVVTSAIKLVLPFGLLFYTGLLSSTITRGRYLPYYIFFFSLFLLWGLIPTLISGETLAWFKLLPRFAFFLSMVSFFSKRPAAFSLFAKLLVIYVLSTLVQYFLVYLTGAYMDVAEYGPHELAGPRGLLGNVTARMHLGGSFPIIRLTGFWNEPSNASGSAFAAFFLARYLVASGEREIWRKASYGALIAGMLALSNAGYIALGVALLVGPMLVSSRIRIKRAKRTFRLMLVISLGLILVAVALLGRRYVGESLSNNIWARGVVGARTEAVVSDPFGGRVEVLGTAWESSSSNIIGLGIQEIGSEGVIDGSGTAPVYWLLLTGIPGLLLLVGREAVLVASVRELVRRYRHMIFLVQALVVIMVQHMVYGTWMNPNYLYLAAGVLAFSEFAMRLPRVATSS